MNGWRRPAAARLPSRFADAPGNGADDIRTINPGIDDRLRLEHFGQVRRSAPRLSRHVKRLVSTPRSRFAR